MPLKSALATPHDAAPATCQDAKHQHAAHMTSDGKNCPRQLCVDTTTSEHGAIAPADYAHHALEAPSDAAHQTSRTPPLTLQVRACECARVRRAPRAAAAGGPRAGARSAPPAAPPSARAPRAAAPACAPGRSARASAPRPTPAARHPDVTSSARPLTSYRRVTGSVLSAHVTGEH